MMRLTLGIVVRALFNVESDETTQISSAMNLIMGSTSGIRMLLPPIARYLPTPKMIGFRRAVAQLDKTVYGIIAQHRARGTDSGDLLSMLIDRKSTRLNSSHSQISYAVFCLRQKTFHRGTRDPLASADGNGAGSYHARRRKPGTLPASRPSNPPPRCGAGRPPPHDSPWPHAA